MDLQKWIVFAFQVSIFATVFGFGLKATTQDVSYLIRRPVLLARSLLAMFVVMPIAALALSAAFDLQHDIEMALIALAVAPLPPLLPKMLTKVAGGNSYDVALVATIGLLSIAIVPLLVVLISGYFGHPFAATPLKIASIVALSILLPLAAGMAFRSMQPALADRIEVPVSIIGSVLLRLAALALLVINWSAIWALIGDGTVIAIVIFVVAGFAAGHLLGGPDPDGRTVLAIASATRHPAVAFSLATANFSQEHFGAAILLYLLLAAIVGVPYTIWRQRSRADAEAAKAILDARQKAAGDLKAGRPAPYYVVPPAAPSGGDPCSVPTRNGEGATKQNSPERTAGRPTLPRT